MRVAAVIPAAGQGKRLKTKKLKSFVILDGKPLLVRTLERLRKCRRFDEVVLAVQPSQRLKVKKLLERFRIRGVRLVDGGKTRALSVKNAVLSLSSRIEWVLIHDMARPLVSASVVKRLVSGALETGAAISALPVTDTVKKSGAQRDAIESTIDRKRMWLAQTPQFFRLNLLKARYRVLGAAAKNCTDEAALFDGSPIKVKLVPGAVSNIKITTREDLILYRYYSTFKK